MLGFATLGKFALGQVGAPSVIIPGVFGTGVAGVISSSTGPVPGVFGAGVAGSIVPSTVSTNAQRLLANVVRRARKLRRSPNAANLAQVL
jgi:hypothetical protein